MSAYEFMAWAAEMKLRAAEQEDRERIAGLKAHAEKIRKMGR